LLIPLTKSISLYGLLPEGDYYSVEISCLGKIILTPSINTVAKLGIGMVSGNGMSLSFYINFGVMVQGSIGY
jgi:hypothetical protein